MTQIVSMDYQLESGGGRILDCGGRAFNHRDCTLKLRSDPPVIGPGWAGQISFSTPGIGEDGLERRRFLIFRLNLQGSKSRWSDTMKVQQQ